MTSEPTSYRHERFPIHNPTLAYKSHERLKNSKRLRSELIKKQMNQKEKQEEERKA